MPTKLLACNLVTLCTRYRSITPSSSAVIPRAGRDIMRVNKTGGHQPLKRFITADFLRWAAYTCTLQYFSMRFLFGFFGIYVFVCFLLCNRFYCDSGPFNRLKSYDTFDNILFILYIGRDITNELLNKMLMIECF